MRACHRGIVNGTTGEHLGWVLRVWCPGCNEGKGWGGLHQIGVLGPNGEPAYGEQWEWDGDLVNPTVAPSIKVTGGTRICHSYLRAGRWEYLADSTHPLAGQTVDMVDLPENWVT